MLATFVIGIREGLEAALIVSIIAAFLKLNGTRRDLRNMWLGVAVATAICIAVGISLEFVATGLPQRQQEMLESVIAAVAVVMVSFMILWMRRNSRGLKAELQKSAAGALERGSALALVAMAALAVLREGFETAVFLVAALQSSTSGGLAMVGALAGILVAVVLGLLIYRGGVRFDMSRFFRITGVVLVLVAAGLVMKTFRAAHEAGWINVGQQQIFDASGVIGRGSITESLATGIFGIQTQPVLIEVLAYLLYAIPMLLVVVWPPQRAFPPATIKRAQLGIAAAAALVAGALIIFAPAPVSSGPSTITPKAGEELTISTTQGAHTLRATINGAVSTLQNLDHTTVNGQSVTRFAATTAATPDPALAATLTGAQIQKLRGGRYPVGLSNLDDAKPFSPTYKATRTVTIGVDDDGRVLMYTDRTITTARVTSASDSAIDLGSLSEQSVAMSDQQSAVAAARSAQAHERKLTASAMQCAVAPLLIGFAAILLLFAATTGRQQSRTEKISPKKTTDPQPLASTTSH